MLGFSIDSQITDTMVEAIEKYAAKYKIADVTKVHLQMHLKEPTNENDSPICYNILDAANGNKVVESPIIEEVLGLRKNFITGNYIDLINKKEICTSYIFGGLLRYAEEYNVAEEDISINVVHNGKLKKEKNVKFYLVNGLDYNNPASIKLAKITIEDFIGLKTTAKLLQNALESGQLPPEQQQLIESQYQDIKKQIEKEEAKKIS